MQRIEAMQKSPARMIKAIENDPAGFEKHITAIAAADGLWQLIIGMSAECDR